ncbi:MAG: DUF4118 domain-containing protein [Proteobacteria bacterium]|nr:DUF4118 domain-containing protein [Pseudomonadota bacterium]
MAVCALATLVTVPLRPMLDLANIVMLFLLTVFLVATRLGRGPAVMAAFLSVALFDFFFVPPHLSFDVADAQYLVTFAVMLAVGLLTAHLTARLGEQTEQALQSAQDTRSLYELACEMAGAVSLEQVSDTARRYLASRDLEASILIVTGEGKLAMPANGDHVLGSMERAFAESAYHRNEIVEADSLAGTGIAVAFFPMRAPTCVRGVLAITPRTDDTTALRALRQAIEAIASLVALAVERLHFAEAAQRADLQIAEERLRTSVLSSLSHDLRTPLTTLVGLADSLVQAQTGSTLETAETARIIRDQAQAMHRLISNLLDMARLHGKDTVLRREWQPFEEVIGSSLRLAEDTLGSRQVAVDVPADLPLLYYDAVLMERVLFNLLENAAKYSTEASPIELTARVDDDFLNVSICNCGTGFPPEMLKQVFELFVRGSNESNLPGVGLGLAICKAIIVAHGGSIHAENRPDGCCVRFTLPCGTPPPIEEEAA